MQKVMENKCALSDMIFKTRVSRGFDDYRQFNDRAAALRQYREAGVEIQAGQSVRYIITDHRSKNYKKRVAIPELAHRDTRYDCAKYCEYLFRAAESILLPFGYTEERLDGMMRGKVQSDLCSFEKQNI